MIVKNNTYSFIKENISGCPLLWLGGACLAARYLYLENYRVQVSYYVIEFPHLPSAFDGLTLLHLSDIHNGTFPEKEESKWVQALSQIPLDAIMVTGDLIDRRKPDLQAALDYIEKWLPVAPLYFVSGNHEARCKEGSILVKALQTMGIHVLDNKKISIKKNRQTLVFMGLPDPYTYGNRRAQGLYIKDALDLAVSEEDFAILLAHRPEYLPLYCQLGVDLVLSGHAHGGQIRLPGIGPLYAPDQGFFPHYSHGSYHLGSTTMLVSRGLGKSVFPQRLCNRPEVGLIRLAKAKAS